jgi:uncharacterized membrane protein
MQPLCKWNTVCIVLINFFMLNFKLSGNTFSPQANKLYEKTSVINVGNTERIISAAAGTALYVLSVSRKKSMLNKLIRMGSLYLLYRGLSGNCPLRASINSNEIEQHAPAVNIRTSLVVNAPRRLVYDTWRNLENLPNFLKHIKKIKAEDEIHSHWVLKTPGRIPSVKWNAEIIEQDDARELSWRSLPGSMVETAGKIIFADTLNGTQLDITISYRPPAGYIGSTVGNFLNPSLKKYVEDDILNFKNYIEKKSQVTEIS